LSSVEDGVCHLASSVSAWRARAIRRPIHAAQGTAHELPRAFMRHSREQADAAEGDTSRGSGRRRCSVAADGRRKRAAGCQGSGRTIGRAAARRCSRAGRSCANQSGHAGDVAA
jgi:hypothetical protein